MQTSEGIGQIAAALAKSQGEFKNPEKNREVEVQPKKRDDGTWPQKYKFKYATFDAILEMARPILAKNEVALLQTAANVGGNIAVTTRFIHSSGEWIEDTIGAQVDGRGLQAMGSTLTYLKRYALTAMLGIAADEDDDANSVDGNLAEVRDRKTENPKTKIEEKDARPIGSGTQFKPPEPEQISDDWKLWIEDFKGQINQAIGYTDARGIWSANNKPINALKKAHPNTYENLSSWVKSVSEQKPKAA